LIEVYSIFTRFKSNITDIAAALRTSYSTVWYFKGGKEAAAEAMR
jgi:hypothetical protein